MPAEDHEQTGPSPDEPSSPAGSGGGSKRCFRSSNLPSS